MTPATSGTSRVSRQARARVPRRWRGRAPSNRASSEAARSGLSAIPRPDVPLHGLALLLGRRADCRTDLAWRFCRCQQNLGDLTSLRLEEGGVAWVDPERGQERVRLRK